MPNTIYCEVHGECLETFVCSHLIEGSGLGFNREDPTEEDPCPDAWCDDCELIFETHQGWTDESQELVKIRMVCSGCYEQSRIRNTRTDVSFDDLASLRWKCGTCEEWHHGACLDFSYDSPIYWTAGIEAVQSDPDSDEQVTSLLNEDFCVLDGNYFVRGIIHLPIIGTNETFRWGVWGSLSEENFKKVWSMNDDPKRVELPPMFSWLSNRIDEYPDTLNLRMYAHIQEPYNRPIFELEPTDHPLSQEFHHGITPERIREIMIPRLKFEATD